jgi:hypothetical protein
MRKGLRWEKMIVGKEAANNKMAGGQWCGWGTTGKKQQTTINGSSAMMEDDGAGSGRQERVEGKGVDEGQQMTKQSTIDGCQNFKLPTKLINMY